MSRGMGYAVLLFASSAVASGTSWNPQRRRRSRGQPYVYSRESQICEDATGLDFSYSSVKHSNLGGKGPDWFKPHEVYFRNVTMVKGQPVDLIIRNTSEYTPFWSSLNKMRRQLAQVNLKTGTTVDLKFSFVDSTDGTTPVLLNRFYFSALDLDAGWHGAGAEWLQLNGYQAYYVSDGSSVSITEPIIGKTRFMGTARGSYYDNGRFPGKAMPLTANQARRTVAFLFTYASEFDVTFGSRPDATWYYHMFSRNILFGGKSAVTCNADMGVKPISREDLQTTYLINWPGTYLLTEDIVFEPNATSDEVTSGMFPDPYSEKYPQLGGYYLGFFAAIVIQAPNVTFDCQGHSISMGAEFHRRQRFFSLFELASKPFISAAGPPQFSSELLSPGAPYIAHNVTIQNCKLGLSSHHAIHGNENLGVTVKNTTMRDFEVAGIHLNGASGVVVENVDIGPSLKFTYSSELSHAIFLDHLMEELLASNSPLYQARMTTDVVLRGETYRVDTVLHNLHVNLRQFLQDRSGPLGSLFNLATELPDGSAVYGIVVHKTGPAVNEFGVCGAHEALENGQYETDLALRNVTIHDLHLGAEQWTRVLIGGKQVMGPAGDVFRIADVVNKTSFQYVGDQLSDAQLAVGALKKKLDADGIATDEAKYYFGGVHVPDAVLDWASGALTDTQATRWFQNNSFQCFGDAMSHVNKGAVGVRIAYINGITMENVNIRDIRNSGKDDGDPNLCTGPYLGKDVHGAVFENIENAAAIVDNFITQQKLNINANSLVSDYGGTVYDVNQIFTRRLDQLQGRADDVTLVRDDGNHSRFFLV